MNKTALKLGLVLYSHIFSNLENKRARGGIVGLERLTNLVFCDILTKSDSQMVAVQL